MAVFNVPSRKHGCFFSQEVTLKHTKKVCNSLKLYPPLRATSSFLLSKTQLGCSVFTQRWDCHLLSGLARYYHCLVIIALIFVPVDVVEMDKCVINIVLGRSLWLVRSFLQFLESSIHYRRRFYVFSSIHREKESLKVGPFGQADSRNQTRDYHQRFLTNLSFPVSSFWNLQNYNLRIRRGGFDSRSYHSFFCDGPMWSCNGLVLRGSNM